MRVGRSWNNADRANGSALMKPRSRCHFGQQNITGIVSLSLVFDRMDGFGLISILVWLEWRV